MRSKLWACRGTIFKICSCMAIACYAKVNLEKIREGKKRIEGERERRGKVP